MWAYNLCLSKQIFFGNNELLLHEYVTILRKTAMLHVTCLMLRLPDYRSEDDRSLKDNRSLKDDRSQQYLLGKHRRLCARNMLNVVLLSGICMFTHVALDYMSIRTQQTNAT